MAIIKTISTQNLSNLNKYIFEGEAHSKKVTSSRVLGAGVSPTLKRNLNGKTGFNLAYITAQETATRKLAGKASKKVQGHHVIISFSDKDFPLPKTEKDLQAQTRQAGKLVMSFLRENFDKSSQYVVGMQRDGDGAKLHAHIAINSVNSDGKTFNTNRIRLLDKKLKNGEKEKGLFSRLQDFLDQRFELVTKRKYKRVDRKKEPTHKAIEEMAKTNNNYVWKIDLQNKILSTMSKSRNLKDFEFKLSRKGIKLRKRKASIGKDDAGHKVYRDAYTYSFMDKKNKFRSIRDFAYTRSGGVRGLGKEFVPSEIEKSLEAQKMASETYDELYVSKAKQKQDDFEF